MSRLLFSVYALAVAMACTLGQSWAQAASGSNTQQGGVASSTSRLTSDQAIAAVRSKEPNSGGSFRVIREIGSSPATQEVAQRSLHEASSHHVSLYDDGIFLDLLNTGGFLILEVGDNTGNAISLHLVTSGPDGRAVIESRKVMGKVSASLAQELVKETADFVDILFATRLDVSILESRFYGGRFPESDRPEEESFFAVPRSLQKIKADQSEIRELAALIGAAHLWPIRYAILIPIYSADPAGAMESAWQKQESLVKEFLNRNGGNSDLVHTMQELESVRTAEQLRNRIATFRDLNDFLEQKLRAQGDQPTSTINRSISTIALALGSLEPPEKISYPVMTASGIIVDWKLLDTGDLAVAQLSLAGD